MKANGLWIFACLFPTLALAQMPISSDTVAERGLALQQERMSLTRHANLLLYHNPATWATRYENDFSQVGIGYDYKKASLPAVAQIGRGKQAFLFNADSYIRLNKQSVVWGKAAYENGKRLQASWNLASDFERVYPYVLADSVTVDLKRETYSFSGGYAHQGRKMGFGADMSYRSLLEYRDQDPRPKNTSLDVKGRIGLSYRLYRHYAIGLYGALNKYSQQGSMMFLSPYGNRVLYHMMGLGMQYSRFKGLESSVKYEGSSSDIGVTWHALDGQGLQGTVQLSREHIQKRLTSKQFLPLCDTYQTALSAQLSWSKQLDNYDFHVAIKGEKTNREGKEHIYDNGVTNYHEIASTKPFLCNIESATLDMAGAYRPHERLMLECLPSVTYRSVNMTYADPYRELKYAGIDSRLNFQISCFLGRNLLSAAIEGSYMAHTSKNLTLTQPALFEKPIPVLEQNYRMLSTNYADFGLSVRYDLSLKKTVRSLYIKTAYAHRHYSNHEKINAFSMSLGVTL